MDTKNRRRQNAFIAFSLMTILPVSALAAQFEGKEISPALGIQPVKAVAPVEFHALPGLDAALRSPVTIESLGAGIGIPVLPTPALQTAPKIETPALMAAPQGPAASLSEINKRVGDELQAAGPVSSASDGDAADLGDRIQRTLGGGDSIGGGSAPPAPAGQTPEQLEKLAALKQVVRVFTEHYAPIEWKESHRGVDFVAEYQKARAKVLANPAMTQHEFQTILADFVAASQDYHAGISFFSTEKAGLPLMILSAQSKHYIAFIDRAALPKAQFPYEPGDEVVKFAGQDVGALAASFTKVPNTAETDARLAEMRLTNRSRRTGSDVPKGPVELTIRTADGATHDVKLDWAYEGELIPTDIPHRGVVLGPETENPLNAPPAPAKSSAGQAVRELLKKFVPSMAHPLAGPFSELAAANPDNGFMIGGKKTYVPELGKVVWELPAQIAMQVPFVVKIYQDDAGRKIGYLRIPDYMGGGNTDAATQLLEKLIDKLEAETDGLVIDQVNNPGGDMFFMNDVASMLTDKPLSVAKHRLMIDESDGMLAAQILKQATDPGMMQEMEEVLQEMGSNFAGGGPGIQALVEYAEFILAELKAGRRLTDPTFIFGVQQIQPHPAVRYTKPVVVLINELDFSAADFFAAVMQDNKRATLFGVRTAGAGGAVKAVEFPNQYGIEHLAYTWTIAIRPGPNGKPIENNGVQPDEKYQITADDLRNGFAGYKKALGDLLARLIGSPAPPPPSGGTVGGQGDDASGKPARTPRRTPRRRPGPRPE